MTAKKAPALLAQAVTLADGPHRLERATWPAIAFFQASGYVIGRYTRSTTDTLVLFGEWKALANAAARLGCDGKAGKSPTWTPELVAEGIAAIDLQITFVPDFGAIAAGITALLRDAEPDEGWDVERVSALMLPAKWESYLSAVVDLFSAGTNDDKPKKSAEGNA